MFIIYRITSLIPHLTLVSLLLLITSSVGHNIYKGFKVKHSPAVTALTSVIIGYIVISVYYFLTGMLGLYREPFLTIIPLSFGAVSLYYDRCSIIYAVKKAYQINTKTVLLLSIPLMLALYSIFPDTGFDSNWYHLSQPQYYLKEGRLFHIGGYIFPSGYPQFAEMLYIPLLHLGNSVTTSAFSFVNYLLLGAAVYVLARKFGLNKIHSMLAVVITLSSHPVFRYSGIAYVDNLQALSLTVALYWLADFIKTSNKKSLILASVTLVPLCLSKYTGTLLCIPLAASLALRTHFKYAIILAAAPLAGLIPWLIRNYIQVGRPLDPLGQVSMFHYGSGASDYAQYLQSTDWLKTIPLLFSSSGEILIPAFTVLILSYSVIFNKWIQGLTIGLMLMMWRMMPPGNDYRYLVPYLPLISVLGLKIVSGLSDRRVKLVSSMIIIVILSTQVTTSLRKVLPLTGYAMGMHTMEEYENDFYTKEKFMFHDGSGRVKQMVGDSKLLIKGADLIYPTLRKFNVRDYSFSEMDRNKIYTFRTLRNEMKLHDYRFFLTNRGDLQQHFQIWFKEIPGDNVDMYFDTLVKEEDQYGKKWYLYKIRDN